MTTQFRRVSEVYPSKWLVAGDLQKPVTVTILCVDVEELRQADGDKEQKLVLTFKSATKRLILNSTQAKRLAELLGDEFNTWVNARVKLAPSKASNGKATIAILEAMRLPEPAQQETEG